MWFQCCLFHVSHGGAEEVVLMSEDAVSVDAVDFSWWGLLEVSMLPQRVCELERMIDVRRHHTHWCCDGPLAPDSFSLRRRTSRKSAPRFAEQRVAKVPATQISSMSGHWQWNQLRRDFSEALFDVTAFKHRFFFC